MYNLFHAEAGKEGLGNYTLKESQELPEIAVEMRGPANSGGILRKVFSVGKFWKMLGSNAYQQWCAAEVEMKLKSVEF